MLERGDQPEEAFRRVVEQRTGGLVHQDDARVHAERARDGQQLHLPDGERGHGLADSAVQPHLIEEGAAELFHAAETDHAAFRKMQVADDDILPGGEVGEQVEFLIDDADAETLRVQRGGDFDGRAVDRNGAAIGSGGAGQNARQRALAGAVFAHERVHFAGAK